MNKEGVQMAKETGRTYYDGVQDAVLFLMEELSQDKKSREDLIAELRGIHSMLLDYRSLNFRKRFT